MFLALQIIFVGFGIWQLVEHRRELLWAAPAFSHINIAVMAYYVLIKGNELDPRGLLRPWVMITSLTSLVSLLLLGLSVSGKWSQTTMQCALCIMNLSVQASRDWHVAREERVRRCDIMCGSSKAYISQVCPQDLENEASLPPSEDIELAEPDIAALDPKRKSLSPRPDSGVSLLSGRAVTFASLNSVTAGHVSEIGNHPDEDTNKHAKVV